FPDGNGTTIDLTNGSTQEIAFTIPMDAEWIPENCELVFFLQDNDTKKIAQGDSVMLNDLTLSIGDVAAQNNDSYFYPNPVKNELSLYAKDFSSITHISISDMLGRIVWEQADYTSAINVEGLPSGVYLVSYKENQQRKTAKVIKQ